MQINGNKTYISAVLLMVNGILYGFGFYNTEVFLAVMAVLGGAVSASLRHGVQKSGSERE